MIYSLLQWKQEARLFITLTLSSFHSYCLLQELTPTPRCTPDCSMYRKPWGREHLGATVFSMKSWAAAQRSWDTGHDRKHINRQIQWQSQSRWWGCAMCNQLKNQEQISFLHSPFHRLFTYFFSFFSAYVSVVSAIAFLCLSSLGTLPFTLSGFFFSSVLFLSASFLSLLILSCFSSFFYWLFSLTARDWAKACRSQSITFKELRIKVLFPLASLLLLQSLFLCSILCDVFLLKDGLLQYAGKEEGL